MTTKTVKPGLVGPQLVAHRGYAARYPENSLAGCAAALALGCHYVEIDIQLCADGVPVLLHDQNLARTAGADILITDVDSRTLSEYDVAERQRLGPSVPFTPLPTLAAYVELLQQWPAARTFIEIKEESLRHFGQSLVAERILASLQPIIERCIIISYDTAVLRHVQALAACPTGWVLTHYDATRHQSALDLAPDYLICNYRKMDDADLWPGTWRWMLYEVTDAALALRLCHRGATLIETMAIGELIKDLRLRHGESDGG
jgi:glycerophosphoryl diester phosphodiesterase